MIFGDVRDFEEILTIANFADEEIDIGLEGSMADIIFVESLGPCFKEVSVMEKDFSF